jgi:hypothetical protein
MPGPSPARPEITKPGKQLPQLREYLLQKDEANQADVAANRGNRVTAAAGGAGRHWRVVLRRLTGILVLLIGCSLIYTLYSLHLGIGHGISKPFVHLSRSWVHKTAVWFDRTAPTPPRSLSVGRAPVIQQVASYYDATLVTKHTMAPFDSTRGDLLVVFAGTHDDALLTPSDNFNNNWISLAGPTNFGPTNSSDGVNLRAQIWYAKNPKVGPNHIFTMTLSKKEALVLSMFVVKGTSFTDPIDAVSPIGNDADTLSLIPTSPRIITTHSNDLLIGFGKSRFGEDWSAGSGFAFQPGASSDFLASEFGLAATAGSYSATFSISGLSNWQAAVVAVKPADTLHNSTPVTLTWLPANDNVGVIGYEVERCNSVACQNFQKIGTSKDTAFVDATPSTPGIYLYRVRAKDEAGNVSKYSETVTLRFGSN